MPSWQSHLVDAVVRRQVKRRILSTEDVTVVRARLGPPPVLRAALSAGLARRAVVTRGVPGEWVGMPRSDAEPVLLFLHGGGYIAGSPATHRPLAAALARRLGARALIPDYRLAPEHPFPSAVEDAVAAFRWLVEDAGVAPSRVVVAGDSAGGGLALAMAIALRDASAPLPRAIALFSPWVDLTHGGASLDENEERCSMLRRAAVEKAAAFYLGGAPADHPLASPVLAELAGLPPLLVHASADELLRDDALRLAEAATRAGVPVESSLYANVPHAFQHFAQVLPEARDSLDRAARFLARCLSTGLDVTPSPRGTPARG